MSVRALFLLTFSIACVSSEPADVLPPHSGHLIAEPLPSPAPPELTVDGLAAGHHALFSVDGLIAGERAHVLIGSGIGDGPCLPVIGGDCLGLTAPFMRVGEGTANADGVAHIVIEVPTSVDDNREASFQAWTRRGVDGDASVSSAPAAVTTIPPELPEAAGHWMDDWGTSHHINRRTWTQSSEGSTDGSADHFHIVSAFPSGDGYTMVALNDEDNTYSPGAWSRFDTVFTADGSLHYCQQAYDAATYSEALATPAADVSDPTAGGCGLPPYIFSFTTLNPVALPIAGSYTDAYAGEHYIDSGIWTITYSWGTASSVSEFHVVDWDGSSESGTVIAQNSEEAAYDPGAWSRFDYVMDEDTLYYCQTLYNAGSEAEALAHPGANASSPAEGGCGEAPYDFPWSALTPE